MALSDPPASLTPTERAAWVEAVSRLRPTSKPTLERAALLETYAVERARWLDAERHLREHGPTIQVRDDRGNIKSVIQAPELVIARTSAKICAEVLRRLRVQ